MMQTQQALQTSLRLRGSLVDCVQSSWHACRIANVAELSIQEQEQTEGLDANGQEDLVREQTQQSSSMGGFQRPTDAGPPFRQKMMQSPNPQLFYEKNIQRAQQSLESLKATQPKTKDPAWYLSRMDQFIKEERPALLSGVHKDMLLEGVRVPMEAYRAIIFACGPNRTNGKYVDMEGLLYFRQQMRRHGYPINDQINAAVITAAKHERRADIIHEFVQDLRAAGEVDSHRIRKVLLAYHAGFGNKDACLKLLDECLAKKDPYLIQAYQEAVLAAAPQHADRFSAEVEPEVRNEEKEAALSYLFKILEDARTTLDFDTNPAEKDALFETALIVLDRLGLYAEVLPCFEELKRPSGESHQRYFVAHAKLANSPDLPFLERLDHAQQARRKLDGFVQRTVRIQPTMTYSALLAFLSKEEGENEILWDRKMLMAEKLIGYLIRNGRYITQERSDKLIEYAKRQGTDRASALVDQITRVTFMTYLNHARGRASTDPARS